MGPGIAEIGAVMPQLHLFLQGPAFAASVVRGLSSVDQTSYLISKVLSSLRHCKHMFGLGATIVAHHGHMRTLPQLRQSWNLRITGAYATWQPAASRDAGCARNSIEYKWGGVRYISYSGSTHPETSIKKFRFRKGFQVLSASTYQRSQCR